MNDHADVNEIRLHDDDDDDDVFSRTVMVVDIFDRRGAIIVNTLFAASMLFCYTGALVLCPRVINKYSTPSGLPSSVVISQKNIAPVSGVSVISGLIHMSSLSDQNGIITVAGTVLVSDKESHFETTFPVNVGASITEERHIFTDMRAKGETCNYVVRLDNSDGAVSGLDVFVSQRCPTGSYIDIVCAVSGLVVITICYIMYRRAEDRTMPPECSMVKFAMLSVMMGSDVWQYVIPFISPLNILFVTRSFNAIVTWIQRLILFSLASGRVVIARKMLKPIELIIGIIAVVIEIVCSFFEVDYMFRYPDGTGSTTVFIMRVLTAFMFAIWTIFVACQGERSVFFAVFFLIVWLGQCSGPLFGDFLGLFKGTMFDLYRIAVPWAICAFLCLVTWPTVIARETDDSTDAHPYQ